MTETVYITGSSGVLGFEALSALTRSLDKPVVGVSRRALPLKDPSLTNIVTPNVLSSSWLPENDKDATLVHFAGLSNPRTHFDGYVDLSIRCIVPHIEMMEDILRRGWRGHLVYISSGGAIYGDVDKLPISEMKAPRPKGYYALQKLSVENALVFLANQYNFRLTILRVSNPYGSHVPKKGQGVIPILLDAVMNEYDFSVIGSGRELRDYLHISDFTDALKRVVNTRMENRINTLNIGSGVGTSLNDLIVLVTELTGRPLNIKRQDAKFDVNSNVLDINRAKAYLAWKPKVSLQAGVQMMVDEYQAMQTNSKKSSHVS